MQALSFSFENTAVRTLGTPETPLFVALDVCNALGFQKARNAVAQHVDAEDLVKAEIDTKGGKQTVNCVNESGLYALIFGSKLESAKRFKRWVTKEVLPQIRRTGCYEVTEGERNLDHYMIRKAVAKRAQNEGAHYQRIYHALYDRFRVASYRDIPHHQVHEALTFIEIFPLEKREALSESIPEGCEALPSAIVDRFLTFTYCWRYLYHDPMEQVIRMLRAVRSPLAGIVWDMVNDLNLGMLEAELAKRGRLVNALPCYQHFLGKK